MGHSILNTDIRTIKAILEGSNMEHHKIQFPVHASIFIKYERKEGMLIKKEERIKIVSIKLIIFLFKSQILKIIFFSKQEDSLKRTSFFFKGSHVFGYKLVITRINSPLFF